jgi:hypothetical protein
MFPLNAVVAQLVERLLAMQKVVSSNLISRSNFSAEELGFPTKQYDSKCLETLIESEGRTVFISRNFVIFHPSLTKCLPAKCVV